MCGIAGMYGSNLPIADGDSILKEMLRLIRHRGPNEAGMLLSDGLFMGTARLSIIGIESGQQPLGDAKGRYFLCYNGEIYNYLELTRELTALGYKFLTKSDTEVVLHAWKEWGDGCLSRFNGAFAFALYDMHEDVLHLARDRYGKRPLFYVEHGHNLIFASEMKSFLAIKDFHFRFDPQQLASIFTLWTPIADQTGFLGIRQVPHGAYVKVTRSGTSLRRYYRQDFASPVEIRSEGEAIERLDSALQDAVAVRLRSDVEVGMYLSGGLDSSIIASLLADQVHGTFRTYSVAFEDPGLDESADQERMAKHVGSRHRTLNITNRMIVDHFPAAIVHAEVPVFRTALVPMYLLSQMVNDDGIRVVMTGEGADEAFLGYDLFKETLLRTAWRTLTYEQQLIRLRRLHPYLKHYKDSDSANLVGLYQQFSEERYPGLFSHELRIQNGLFSLRLLKDQTGAFSAVQQLIQEHSEFAGFSAIEKAQWLEYQTLLPGYLLSSQGDRMALAHSVENRCPFLDPRVVGLSASVNLKFDDGADEKYLLRKTFANRLPVENLVKRKHPYRAPDGSAFAQCRPEYLELLLSDTELRKNEMLNPTFCRLLTNKVLAGADDELSTKENQAFIFLLSVCIQHDLFVSRNLSLGNKAVDDILVKVIDRRTATTRGREKGELLNAQ